MKHAARVAQHVAHEWEIECHFCGESATSKDLSPRVVRLNPVGAGAILAAKGWREVTSRKFQVVAAACPKCASTKDKDRGE